MAKPSPAEAEESQEQPRESTFGEAAAAYAFRRFGWASRFLSSKMPELPTQIMKSGMTYSTEAYLSLVVMVTVFTLPVVAVGLALAVLFRLPLLATIAIAPVLAFGLGLSYPSMIASGRSAALDDELPFVVGYITVLASGGVSPIMTLKRLSNVSLYPKSALEARRILMDIEIFANDPITALEKAARYNPNRVFADFFGGYTSVLKTGGDTVDYMQSKVKDVFAYRAIKVKSAADTIGTFAESYISVAVILGIGLFVLFAVQTILGSASGAGSGGGGVQRIILLTTVFNPAVSAVFIYISHSVQPKEPFNYYRPYFIFLASVPIIPIAVILPLHGVSLVYKLAAGLTLATLPGAIVSIRENRARGSLERMIPSFIRDIAEVRKTGLAPEKCIEQVATRNYGGLSRVVSGMASELSWGIPLRQIVQGIMKKTRSWMTQATMFLLSEVVDVGGGTPEMLGTLADFVERTAQIDKEKKSQLRPYVFIPYFGAIMIVVTTVLMVYFLTSPVITGQGYNPFSSGINAASITSPMLAGAVFTSWVMGFVAGKMGEGSIAAGFKHASLLAAVSGIVVFIATVFFKIPGV